MISRMGTFSLSGLLPRELSLRVERMLDWRLEALKRGQGGRSGDAMCIRALSIVSMFLWDNALNYSIMGGIPDDADT